MLDEELRPELNPELNQQCSYVFVSDNLAYPYGDKDEATLNKRVSGLMAQIIDRFQPDIAVVACNTASTVVLPMLREQFDIPIIGVVPAIKPAAQLSKSKQVGLLATPGTIKRNYTKQLIEQFARDCRVISVGSSRLVDMAEAKLHGKSVDLSLLEAELKPILAARDCDILVLACTHFPLLSSEIAAMFKQHSHPITLLDSGQGIARRVLSVLSSMIITSSAEAEQADAGIAVFTKAIDSNGAFIKNLQRFNLDYAGLL